MKFASAMLERILSKLNSIPADKVYHFAGGALLFAVLLPFTGPVYADAWAGRDKVQHASVGAIIGTAIAASTGSPLQGCVAAATVGAAKEIYDAAHPSKHDASIKDFVVTAAFGCAFAYTTNWVITPKEIRYSIKF